jgi:hypothetical protein
MRRLKNLCIYFIFFILIIPLSATAQVSAPSEVPKVIPAEEVQKFIVEYKVRFMKLDLDGFMSLFSKEATENRMIPYDDIREAYHRTIAYSKSIIYDLEIYQIQTYTQTAHVTGHFKIIQALKSGGKKRLFQGDIQWELVKENGSLRIKEVNYGKKPLR